jgi:hypothetical protein
VDLGKRGVVHAFPAGNANPLTKKITVSLTTIPAFRLAAQTFALGRTPPMLRLKSSARTRPLPQQHRSMQTTRKGCSLINCFRR